MAGHARIVAANTGRPTRVTVADGLSNGPHQAVITATTSRAQSTSIAGFVVVRRTINGWIYPWLYAVLALLLLLNLASLVWAILHARAGASTLPGDRPRLLPAADLRAARNPSQHR